MSNQPLILLTNDDGIGSPGLHAVAEAVADLGELLILAPHSQQTGAGRSYPSTADRTLHSTTIPFNGSSHPAYTAKVSPAQAVALAAREVAQRPIDLCISGINYGENIGSGVTISGTVGAAIDAACFGIPALAISLETPREYHLSHSTEVDFSVAAHFARYFTQQVLANGLPERVDFLKIDVPATATQQTAWRMATVSRQRYYDLVYQGQVTDIDPEDALNIIRKTVRPESDVFIFAIERLVAVAPMTIDLTAPVGLEEVGRFFG
jgi:5'-nucleotidase